MKIDKLLEKSEIDRWENENESFSLPVSKQVEEIEYVEEEIIKGNMENIPIIFLDGKQRLYFSLISKETGEKIIFTEVNCGGARYDEKLTLLFSPQERPPFRRVAIFGADDYKMLGEEEIELSPTIKFNIINSNGNDNIINELRNNLEEEEILKLSKKYHKEIIIKDGLTARKIYFNKENLIVGLVKSQHIYYDMIEEIKRLKKSERSKIVRIAEGEGISKYFSYLRLTDRYADSLAGIVRMEVLSKEDGDNIELIKGIFNYLAEKIPEMTDVIPEPRSPENIFPIMCIEKSLEQFFYDSRFLRSYVRR